MSKNTIVLFKKLGDIPEDPVAELLHSGARKLVTDAVFSLKIRSIWTYKVGQVTTEIAG